MSENLAKLAQKIDFSSSIENGEQVDQRMELRGDEQSDSKEMAAFQASLWPWDSVRSKLR